MYSTLIVSLFSLRSLFLSFVFLCFVAYFCSVLGKVESKECLQKATLLKGFLQYQQQAPLSLFCASVTLYMLTMQHFQLPLNNIKLCQF